jgi:hypothetical protein
MKSALLLFLALAAHAVHAQTPPRTEISGPLELIVATAFDEDTPATRKGIINGWQASIGEWTVKDGALHGDEVPEDKHASSCTYKIDATNLVITAQFRLGEATHLAFGCRDTIAPHHHLARTFISKDAIWIQHMSGIAKTTKAVKAAELKTPIDPEAWHDLMIEISGDHYRAKVDGHVIEARHERFADAKGIVALIVKGQGAQFKNLKLWKTAKEKVAP